ncbi:hypothetical protein [Streptomyces sp. NBC_00878]|uniref:hypothetical protein n=1 Tax=Streptomyces sp. NBC_00878 TaxID=2975854 RepID=UPI00224E3231|nr:hypothetical protein [Streptomyces sp. NBC_00878]MCX4907960.1 hypothetical protein [Streptomyces sp. NBC_00878]
MKRSALAASALSVVVLTGLTGLTACGGGDSETDADDKPGAKATASKAKEVSPAERLAKLMVTKAESGYTVKEPSDGDALAASQEDMDVDKAVCTPLAYAMNELPIGSPQATLTHVATSSAAMFTYITLSTYEDGEAESAMKDLAKAADSCGSGYTATSDRGTTRYDSVTVETAPSGSDESLATAATFKFKGFTQKLRTQTFRFGDTIVNYFALDSGAFIQSRPGEAKIPADLVKAQNAKLS